MEWVFYVSELVFPPDLLVIAHLSSLSIFESRGHPDDGARGGQGQEELCFSGYQ